VPFSPAIVGGRRHEGRGLSGNSLQSWHAAEGSLGTSVKVSERRLVELRVRQTNGTRDLKARNAELAMGRRGPRSWRCGLTGYGNLGGFQGPMEPPAGQTQKKLCAKRHTGLYRTPLLEM